MMNEALPAVGLLLVLLQLAVFQHASSSPSTVPAFLWSPHRQHEFLDNRHKEAVNYQTILPKDLAKSVLYEGGWSNFLCSGEKSEQPVDLAIVFVGRELQLSHITAKSPADRGLVDLLKDNIRSSNFSMAFPYVAASEEEALENLLVSGFKKSCGDNLGINSGAFMELCFVEDENFQRLSLLHSIDDYLVSRMEMKPKGQTDLFVFCNGGFRSSGLDKSSSEGKILSEIIASAERSGAKYEVLYISDPLRSIAHRYTELGRFLAEDASGNGTAKSNFTRCDEVCQIKSSLLEGVLVGIVLLIILISGLCCMMGIDTPTRFETPQES